MAGIIVAAVQMTSGQDKTRNIEKASQLISEAAARGAQFIALPELFPCIGDPATIVASAESVPGPISETMSELARELGVTLLAGSLAERCAKTKKVYNTSLLFSPSGEQIACYRKIHLFDVELPNGVVFRESGYMEAGSHIVTADTVAGRVGLATCYDLRFPELFRRLVTLGSRCVVLPAAFTAATGRDHWQVLLRARAIENQVFVIAPNQFGQHTPTIVSYGRSMIVDPWGTVLATATDGEGIVTAEIDPDALAQVRSRLPALAHRRNLDEFESDG